MIHAAILGASGYTGAELLRLLRHHDQVKVVALSAESQAGKTLAEVYPHLRGLDMPVLQKVEEIDFSKIDLVFCCLPHATTQEIIRKLPESLRIVDLSADFRLRDVAEYEAWYGKPHAAPELQKQAVYGLTEHFREEVRSARLVANPGCYPTAAQLPLIPLLRGGVISSAGIIIDAKSGVTGAGRKAAQHLLFTELNDSLSAYGVGKHRHIPEIEQGLGDGIKVSFTPHLIPMNRGILETIYVQGLKGASLQDLQRVLEEAYQDELFVDVLPSGEVPSTAQVRGSNKAALAVQEDRIAGRFIIISVIDNLIKGASGQAIQNMNLMFGLNEDTGLLNLPVFP